MTSFPAHAVECIIRGGTSPPACIEKLTWDGPVEGRHYAVGDDQADVDHLSASASGSTTWPE
jgi:hypothetical protein